MIGRPAMRQQIRPGLNKVVESGGPPETDALDMGFGTPAPKPATRDVVRPPRNGKGWFVQPHEVGPKREVMENHNRGRFANHLNFADQYTGNTRSFDPSGRYNCGRCNQYRDGRCLLLDIGHVDAEAGSCEDWENRCAGDPEMVLNRKSPDQASYGVAANGRGFGCHRCPFAEDAHAPDSIGRDMYCRYGDFRTFGAACCALNGAPLQEDA